MAFPEKFINELTERSDIVDVVSEYVQLGKRSGSNMFGLCPFHSEKTPSFSVSPDKQFYHCFGCGKGGGVINFIMELENLSYPDAIAFLARRAGMALPEQEDSAEAKKRARMLALNKDAARFFYEQLKAPTGSAARAYVAKRGIDVQTAKRFGLGAAPDAWSSLLDAMEQKGYSRHELQAAGLIRMRDGRCYDTFRNRLMFPVIDVRGNVIGFSGRILGDGEPKYMNSPETAVFNKSRNLFALNLAKKSKSGYILLTEGNIDVVSLHQAGFDSAVASLGTSLTPEQARLISRYSSEVIIAYDSDGAGQKASQRAIGLLEKLDLKVKVLSMSGAKDPDEFIKARGAEAFRLLINGSENQIDYRLRTVTEKYDLAIDEQKVEFLKEASELIARLPGQVERQVYSMRVADMASVNGELIASEVERRRRRLISQARKAEDKQQTAPIKQLAPPGKKGGYDDPSSAAAEEGLIRLIYLEPELAGVTELPKAESFSSPELARIYTGVLSRIDSGESVSVSTLAAVLSPEDMSILVSLLQKPELLNRGRISIKDYISKINERYEMRAGDSDLRSLAQKLRKTKGYEV